jgi:hypothetical protein
LNLNYLYCQRCGNASQAGSQVCQNCGSPLQAQTLPPAQSPIPQQFAPPVNIYPVYAPLSLPKKKSILPGIISGMLVTIAVAAVVFLLPDISSQNTARQAETQAAATLKYSAITLSQNDFPPGFEILTAEEAAARGVVDLTPNYVSSHSKANVVFSTTAILGNANTSNSVFVQAWVAAPLSQEELSKYKSDFANPAASIDQYPSTFSDLKIWQEAGNLGNGSMGITFTLSGTTFKGEFITGYRGDAIFTVGSIWDSNTVHKPDTLYLASRLDEQINALQR